MHPNHEFLLDFASSRTDGRVLDYGCGAGEVVAEGVHRGINFEGAEVFYEGGDTRGEVERIGLLGTRVHEIENGRVPVEDGWYDLVVSNQVFEHVEDLDGVLHEIDRILAPDGQFLSMFPSRDVWREGHCGVPFLHRLPPNAKLTRRYAVFARRAGLGYNKGDVPPEEWAVNFIDWVQRYCFYRPRQEIERSYGRYFELEPLEDEHAAFRLRQRFGNRFDRLIRLPGFDPLARLTMRKLAHLTFVARKLSRGHSEPEGHSGAVGAA